MTGIGSLATEDEDIDAPASRERISACLANEDDDLRDAVCYRLRECRDLDAADVRVRAIRGEITLEGRIRTNGESQLVEAIAATVPDVRRVHNALQLR